MIIVLVLCLFIAPFSCAAASKKSSLKSRTNYSSTNGTIKISAKLAQKIGIKIWHNECNGSLEGLTSWNNGEDFASLGIGHFIWYPQNAKTCYYHATFPHLLQFLKDHGKPVPAVVVPHGYHYCLWNNQQEFKEALKTPLMEQLRTYLHNTIDLQIKYMIQRLKSSRAKLLEATDTEKKVFVRKNFDALAQTPNGLYALIDYINFKGEGIAPQEAYNNCRWGLLQVLEKLPEHGDLVTNFINTAKTVLADRVNNAPAGKDESRWIPGWYKRLDTYKDSL